MKDVAGADPALPVDAAVFGRDDVSSPEAGTGGCWEAPPDCMVAVCVGDGAAEHVGAAPAALKPDVPSIPLPGLAPAPPIVGAAGAAVGVVGGGKCLKAPAFLATWRARRAARRGPTLCVEMSGAAGGCSVAARSRMRPAPCGGKVQSKGWREQHVHE